MQRPSGIRSMRTIDSYCEQKWLALSGEALEHFSGRHQAMGGPKIINRNAICR